MVRASPLHPAAPSSPARTGAWQAAVDALPDNVAVLDTQGRVVAVNASWSAFAAANSGGDGVGVGADYLAVCDAATDATEETASHVARAIRAAAAGAPEGFDGEYPCHSPSEQRWFTVLVRPALVGAEQFVIVAHRNITQRRTAERATREHASMLDAANTALIATDRDGVVTQWTRAAEQLYGWTSDEVVGTSITDLTVGPADQAEAKAIMGTMMRSGVWEGQFDVQRKDGSRFPAWVRNTVLRDDAGHPTGFVGVSIDISERVHNERVLRGTRDFLYTVTETMPDGMYVLDADGLVVLMNQAAETLLGWEGDELLGKVMHEVTHCVREDGSPRPIEECAIARARQTRSTVRVESDVFLRRDGSLMPVAYSAASCEMPDGEVGLVVVFNDISERKEKERRLVRDAETLAEVSRIREALDNEHFVLYAQPIVDLRTRQVARHELLIRMLDARGGVIPPGVFLPVAERTGLIREIDRYVIERAMRYASAGEAVAVNISAASLSDPYLTAFVDERLRHHRPDPSRLSFEVTETALMEHEDAAQAFVARVTDLGCSVALDDFGTGFGTFRYLKHFPAPVLKIDREFVKDITTDPSSAHVVQTIVRLAIGMDKKTVAEGIEDAKTLAAVQAIGVDFAQGYFLGRALPADAVFARPG